MILLFLGYYLEDLIFFFLHYTALIRTQITSQLSKYNFYSENSQLQLIKLFIEDVEENFKKYNQLTLIISLITFYYILRFNITSLVKMWFSLNSLSKIKAAGLNFLLKFSFARKFLESKKKEIFVLCRNGFKLPELQERMKGLEFKMNGQDYNKIIPKIVSLSDVDRDIITKENKISGAIYVDDLVKFENFVAESMKLYSYHNLVQPLHFASARYIETQLVKIGVDLFRGTNTEDDICGLISCGGTESLVFAVLAYLHRSREKGITQPELICCENVHVSIIKACDAFKVTLIEIPSDKNYRMNNALAKKAINSNTICIIGSFPSYPHGIHDDIEGLSEICHSYDIPLHVDCCLGGLLIPFYAKAKINIPKFDFSLKGVTSISADFHKYGLSSKGVSVVLYRNKELRRNQFFIYPHWDGGLYFSPSYNGSRTPALLVASYGVMLYMGKQRLAKQAEDIHNCIIDVCDYIRKELPEIQVIGDPQICVISLTGDIIMKVNDFLTKKRKWQFTKICRPSGIHFSITSANLKQVKDHLRNDLRDACDFVHDNPNEKLATTTEMYGLSVALPEELVKNNLDVIVDSMLDY